MKHLSLLTVFVPFLLFLPFICQAQTSYHCDFETDSLRQQWFMNKTANATIQANIKNWWYIGESGNNTINGKYGLYISDDGVNPHYANSRCFVLAYTKVQLDQSDNGYQLSFDWKSGIDNYDGSCCGLYAFWLPVKDPQYPDRDFSVYSSTYNSSTYINSKYGEYVIRLDPKNEDPYLRNGTYWQRCTVDIPKKVCDGKPHYLAFGWWNNDWRSQQHAACVDNIHIVDTETAANICNKPEGLDVTMNESDVIFKWNKTESFSYEVGAFVRSTKQWYGPFATADSMYVFPGLFNIEPGMVDFYVRSKCDENDLFSPYSSKSIYLYSPDDLCIDYLNLNDSNCLVAVQEVAGGEVTIKSFVPGVVNYGPDSRDSRHTVHTNIEEMDPRTDYQLHTVPTGAYSSVRLGNWDINAQAERVEYVYPVRAEDASFLTLKYAVLLEAPYHESDKNPRFTLDILADGKPIGAHGQADFNCMGLYEYNRGLLPSAEEQGWHITSNQLAGTYADIIWKDWSTVSVNLSEYDGQTLLVRLTTYDCMYGAHCGYAYFTLGCMQNTMQVDSTSITFDWPFLLHGFMYNFTIYSDAEMTMPLFTLVFDKYGHLIDTPLCKRNKPLNSHSRIQDETFTIMVDGLDLATHYFYRMVTTDENEEVIDDATGEFSTLAPTSIVDVSAHIQPDRKKMMIDNQLIIIRNGVKYNTLGAVVE